MPLDPKDFPEIPKGKIETLNKLTDAELQLEVEKGRNSVYGAELHPVIRTALTERRETARAEDHEREMDLAKKANDIAELAVEEARKANGIAERANQKAGLALWMSALAIVAAALAPLLISFWRG